MELRNKNKPQPPQARIAAVLLAAASILGRAAAFVGVHLSSSEQSFGLKYLK